MQGLAIRMLGRPRIELDGGPVSARIPAKAQAMLYYVAALGTAQPRASIAALLWGGLPSHAARANLRLTLTRARRVLGETLEVSDGAVALATRLTPHVDVRDFDAVTERLDEASLEDLEAAVACRTGEFLDGFEIADASAFGDWVESERLRTRSAAYRLWQRLGALREARGDVDGAIDACRHRICLEPWDEAAHEELMLRLARSGRPLAALAQYETLRRTVAEELGARPGPSIEASYRSIRAAQPSTSRADAVHGAVPAAAPAATTVRVADPASATGAPVADALPGREAELLAIEQRLADADCRALVLLGPGGVGKTRLARAAAARIASRFRDGAVYVALADQSAANAAEAEDRVVGAIAQALGLALPGPQPARETLPAALAARNLLLVLDNVEVVRAAAPWLSTVLLQAPRLKCLLTSRQRMNLPEAWLLDVHGLREPDAVALFERCARRVSNDFDPGAQAVAIRRICALVGGSPLAIELAARRVHTLSCSDIASRLGESIDLLGDDIGESRHCSVRAVLEDSWAAMDDRRRSVAARASVFDGAFDLDAARAVAGIDALGLAALAEHSWLDCLGDGRFAMHPLVRHYTRARREREAPDATGLPLAHARHYLARYAGQASALERDPAPEVLARADADVDELRAAIAWALEHADTPLVVALVDAATPYLLRKGRIDEFESAMQRALARGDVDDGAAARWKSRLGHGRFAEGRPAAAMEIGSRALVEFGEPMSASGAAWYAHTLVAPLRYARARRRLGADAFGRRARSVIDSLCYVGQMSYFIGETHKSLALCLRALALVRDAGPCAESACAAAAGAFVSGTLGFDAVSRRLARRAIELGRDSDSALARAHALGMTSLCRVTRGNWAGLDENLAEAVELYRALGQPRWMMETYSIRGKALYLQARLAQARHVFEQMDVEARHAGHALGRHWSTLGLVECGLRLGDMPVRVALELLADVRRYAGIVEIGDPAEIIRQHGLHALFLFRAGRRREAREATEVAAALIGRTSLCGFWALEGYSGTIETALALADDEPGMLALARSVSRRFDRVARQHPVLRARAAWARAMVEARRRGTDADPALLGRAAQLADRWHAELDRRLLAHA